MGMVDGALDLKREWKWT